MHFLKDCHCHSHKTELFPDNSIMSSEPINYPGPTRLHTGCRQGCKAPRGRTKGYKIAKVGSWVPSHPWQTLIKGMKQVQFALALIHESVQLSTDLLLPMNVYFHKGKVRSWVQWKLQGPQCSVICPVEKVKAGLYHQSSPFLTIKSLSFYN